MKWYQRIVKVIIHQPIRYLLLLGVIFVSSTVLLGSFIIRASMDEIYSDMNENLGVVATVQGTKNSLNLNGLYPEYENYNVVFNEYHHLLEKCSKDERILYRDISYFMPWVEVDQVMNINEYSSSDFMLTGFSNPAFQEYYTHGLELIEGSLINDLNEYRAIIPDQYVYTNGSKIEVGDVLTIQNSHSSMNSAKLAESGFVYPKIQVKVAGIYHTEKEIMGDNSLMYPSRIYVSNQVLVDYHQMIMNEMEKHFGLEKFNEIQQTSEFYSYYLPIGIYAPYFHLKSYDDLESFKDDWQSVIDQNEILSKIYHVETTADTAERILNPLKNIKKMSNIIYVMAILVIGLIIGLLALLFTKNRKQEIYIYQVLGERKINLLKQLVGELLVIGCMSLMITFFISKPLQKTITKQLDAYIIQQESGKENENQFDYYTSGHYVMDPNQLSDKSMTRYLEVDVKINDYIQLVGIVIVSCLFGGLMSYKVVLKELESM